MDQTKDGEMGSPLPRTIVHDVVTVIEELAAQGNIRPRQILVVGASTSEVLGKRIGTFGSEQVAKEIFQGVIQAVGRLGCYAAFQCCEHLNRALVIEREALEFYTLEEVAVIPAPKAGGTLAAYAYRHLREPCVVESVRAHGGIDIGSTLIGMHLRPVAVPFRPSIRKIGEAYVTAAYTRPKYIGGPRAVYTLEACTKEITE